MKSIAFVCFSFLTSVSVAGPLVVLKTGQVRVVGNQLVACTARSSTQVLSLKCLCYEGKRKLAGFISGEVNLLVLPESSDAQVQELADSQCTTALKADSIAGECSLQK